MPRAFQPAEPGTIELVFRFTLFGIPIVIVISVRLDTGLAPTPTQLNAVATAADNWMQLQMMNELSVDLLYTQLQATDISVSTGLQVTIDHGAGIAGGVSQPALPSQVAAVVTLYTALRGRSYRGRTFLPGIPVNYQASNANTITTAGVSNMLTAYNGLTTYLGGASCHQTVLSRVSGGVRRTTALNQAVTSRTMDTTFDTQRRRGANAHKS